MDGSDTGTTVASLGSATDAVTGSLDTLDE
jgi:hypothetical protein